MKSPATLPKLDSLPGTEISLPRALEPLYRLAYNLWWTWTPEAQHLFASIDEAAWARDPNPVRILATLDSARWETLQDDEGFLARFRRVLDAFDQDLETEDTWFARQEAKGRTASAEGPVAYASMEYGLDPSLPIYSGGLGILSGDHLKSASDLGVPLVGFGLLYRRGYFQQTIDPDGIQQHIYPRYEFGRMPVRPLASRTGRHARFALELPGREIDVALWLIEVGRIPLILLDTDLASNHPADRAITNQLYVQGREMRLVQEIVLGIGAARAAELLDLEPSVWHINEGHSAFLQLERLRQLRDRGLDLETAQAHLGRRTVFTTHTPVAAGNEQFDRELVEKYTKSTVEALGWPFDDFLAFGQARDGELNFNLTAFAIRTARQTNGVSRLNAEVTSDMWRHLFPAGTSQPIQAVTNGIHTKTWIGLEVRELFERHLGADWWRRLVEPDAWPAIEQIDDQELWRAHLAQKARLGRFLRTRLREQMARHGKSPDELRAIEARFDPRALTIGFARRFATYKRANLLLTDRDRLRALLTDPKRPVQLIFAGKAHPADRPGQKLIRSIVELGQEEALRGTIFFLENYDMRIGQMLVQGVDVWLNTPRRPYEASGTSGMKVASNGGLNCSILDGWWPEGFDGENGWAIGGTETLDDDKAQDANDAELLYRGFEDDVVPLYYDQDRDGLPRAMIARMKHAMATLTAAFSSDRMVRDYVETVYWPR